MFPLFLFRQMQWHTYPKQSTFSTTLPYSCLNQAISSASYRYHPTSWHTLPSIYLLTFSFNVWMQVGKSYLIDEHDLVYHHHHNTPQVKYLSIHAWWISRYVYAHDDDVKNSKSQVEAEVAYVLQNNMMSIEIPTHFVLANSSLTR